jgi:hypothetical protein
MPIRTPRGRSAAYRGIWQWPLRSPARLAGVVVLVLAVVAGISVAAGALNRGRDQASPIGAPTSYAPGVPSSTGSPRSPIPTLLPPVPDLRPTSLPVSEAPPAALDVARRWTQAWLRPPDGTTAQQWLDGLRPLTTDEYMGVLTSVDPSNIPATKITGVVRAVQVAPQSVRVEVPTDALKLVVVVVDDGNGGWRVADYDQG